MLKSIFSVVKSYNEMKARRKSNTLEYKGHIIAHNRKINGTWILSPKNSLNVSNSPNKGNVGANGVRLQFMKNNGKLYNITRNNNARTFTMWPVGKMVYKGGDVRMGFMEPMPPIPLGMEYSNNSNRSKGITYSQNRAKVNE